MKIRIIHSLSLALVTCLGASASIALAQDEAGFKSMFNGWIKTVAVTDDEEVRKAVESQRELYPIEYATPVHPTADGATAGIVASHSLIPQALYHAFATFGSLMSPDLPLTRRQHEMITTVVSVTNRCHY